MTRPIIIAIATAVASAAAGCTDQSSTTAGASSAGSAVAPRIEACALLTEEEIAAATGVALAGGQEQSSGGGGENQGHMTSCSWQTPDDAANFGLVVLTVWSWPPGSTGAANYVDAFRKVAAEIGGTTEPETLAVGDEALWDGTNVNARKGDVSISISATAHANDSRTTAKALAERILSKL
jgi:hypothetical protein